MPPYSYKAKKDSIHTVTGQIDAANQEEAIELIHQMGLVPIAVEEKNAQGVLVSNIYEIRRIKSKEVFLFTKQLAGLIKSGIPLLKALEVIGEQTKECLFCESHWGHWDRC